MIQTVCVCGAGTMGRGIAQTSATAGFYTILFELNEDVLEKSKSNIENNLQTLVDKNKISEADRIATLNKLHFTNDLFECLADVVIEAIIEDTAAKVALFNQLAEINHSETVFATNTSSLSITQIASAVKNPERVIGMHFFNPATLMKLIEIVATDFTNHSTLQFVIDFSKQMNKTPVLCKDAPGFIVNRVARPYYIESLRLLEENCATISSIDCIMEASGFKMGPFKLMDLIGNDINYAVSCSVYQQLQNPERLKPSFIQKEKVANGELGKKVKKGYYNYE